MSSDIIVYDDDVVDGEIVSVSYPVPEELFYAVQNRIEHLMELATRGEHSTTIGKGELREYFGTPPGVTGAILRWSYEHPTPKMKRLSRNISWGDE